MSKYTSEELRTMALAALHKKARGNGKYTVLIMMLQSYTGQPAAVLEQKIRELAQ